MTQRPALFPQPPGGPAPFAWHEPVEPWRMAGSIDGRQRRSADPR